MIKKVFIILSFVLLASWGIFFSAHAEGSVLDPAALLTERTKAVQLTIKKITSASAPEEIKKTQEELKEEINKLLDFDELAERALGQHKQSLSEPQFKEFNALLRELIERAYTGKIKSNAEFTFRITKKEVSADDAFVEMTAEAGDKSAKTAYRLHKKNGRWIAYDFIIEDVSLVKQYKTQFNKIISEQGFDTLLSKMRKKLEELVKSEEQENAKEEISGDKTTTSLKK
ncbi:MAG: hypothetical protein Kow0090_06040 [Myxococcota bacterium]